MKKGEQYFIVTFPTTTSAIQMERLCKERHIPGRLIPVLRSIKASCGMCWAAPLAAQETIEALLIAEKMQIDGLYVKEL